MPAKFLMQQMAWREALDEAHSIEEVEAIASDVAERQKSAFAELQQTFDERRDVAAAAQQVRASCSSSALPMTSIAPRSAGTITTWHCFKSRARRRTRSASATHRGGHRPGHHAFARGCCAQRRV